MANRCGVQGIGGQWQYATQAALGASSTVNTVVGSTLAGSTIRNTSPVSTGTNPFRPPPPRRSTSVLPSGNAPTTPLIRTSTALGFRQSQTSQAGSSANARGQPTTRRNSFVPNTYAASSSSASQGSTQSRHVDQSDDFGPAIYREASNATFLANTWVYDPYRRGRGTNSAKHHTIYEICVHFVDGSTNETRTVATIFETDPLIIGYIGRTGYSTLTPRQFTGTGRWYYLVGPATWPPTSDKQWSQVPAEIMSQMTGIKRRLSDWGK